MHILIPGDWTVMRGHQLGEDLEAGLRRTLPNSSVLTHLEPLDDPTAWDDEPAERAEVQDAPPRWN